MYPSRFALLLLLLSTASANAAEPELGPVANQQKYLIFDTLIVASKDAVTLELGTVTKHAKNPLMVEDKPWELRYDNLYPNVSYDPKAKSYMCWYSPFIRYGAVEAVLRGEVKKEDLWAAHLSRKYPAWETGVALATSDDGLVWKKPELGLYDYKGSTKNNIVAPIKSPAIHGAGIFLDTQETDPKKRFKLFTRMSGKRPIGVAYSEDGIHFPPAKPGIVPMTVHGDTHNNAFWAPTLKKYVAFSRMIDSDYGGRVVLRTESEDFDNWTPPEMVLHGDAARQTYAMLPCHDAGLYIGMLMMYDKADDRTFCEVTWSRDTKVWHRLLPGKSLIPNGAKRGDYDWGCVYAAQPMIRENDIQIYYGGSNDRHFGWREGCLALATLRRDGWAGFKSKDDGIGRVTTNPVKCLGEKLCVSADAAGGSVRVTVLSQDGKALMTSEPLTGNVTNQAVVFPNQQSLADHLGKPLAFQFELQRAKLYAFGFAK